MNTKQLDIVKRIVAERGEDILADADKLKPLFSDYAKDEPKEERVAFGRCVQMGSYRELKNTASADERRRKKAALADALHNQAGIDMRLCTGALDLMEAVLFPAASASPMPETAGLKAGIAKRISKRSLAFGVAGALGGLAGSLVGGNIGGGNWIPWIAAIALGVSAGLLAAQNIYLKKKPALNSLVKALIFGTLLGAAAGFIAMLSAGIIPGDFISRLIAWGITGVGIGFVTTKFISNYPGKRAMAAGLLGGIVAYVVVLVIRPLVGGFAGIVIGDMVLGFFIGASVSIIEEALREAWLTVMWGPKETRNIALGAKPVAFGSSPEADIYLSGEMPVRATVQVEGGQVVMQDRQTGQRTVLQNGGRVDFGKICFVVNTKK